MASFTWKSLMPGGEMGPVAGAVEGAVDAFRVTPEERREKAAHEELNEKQKAEKARAIQLLAVKGYDEAQAAQVWEQLGKPVNLGDKVYEQAAEAVALGVDISQGTWSQQYQARKDAEAEVTPEDTDAPLTGTEEDELYGPWERVSGMERDDLIVLQEAIEMSGGDLASAMSLLDKMKGIEPAEDPYVKIQEELLAEQKKSAALQAQFDLIDQQMAVSQMPASSWIQQWGLQNQGAGTEGTPATPPTPDWLAEHSALEPGQPIQETQLTTPSVQSWNQMTPNEQEGMTGYLRWMGAPAEDFYSRMRKLAPPGGNGGWSWPS